MCLPTRAGSSISSTRSPSRATRPPNLFPFSVMTSIIRKMQYLLKLFSSEELRHLAHLYGVIVEASATRFLTVAEMLKDPNWRRVVEVAKSISHRFRSDN